jgi:hypothetical protein
MASDPEDAEEMEVNDLHIALDEAETEWFEARAVKQRVPFPRENLEDAPRYRLKPEALREFKDAVIKAEREAWKQKREWAALIIALSAAAWSVYSAKSTDRKLNDIQGKLSDTQAVLADTQAKLYDTQRKLTDVTEQVRRRELTTGKRGKTPRKR